MKSVLLNNIAVQSAQNFINLFGTANIYLFVGNDTTWASPASDSNPPQPHNDVSDEVFARNNIIALFKITTSDVFSGIFRYNWTLGTVYTPYSSTDSSLFTEQFFVYTADGNVYKCLNNNNGAASTAPPVGTSVNTLILPDGYQWKFMYNLSSIVSNKFLTSLYVPCPVNVGDKTSFQLAVEASAAYATGSPPGGHGSNAASELGAANFIMSITNNTDSNFPILPEHRQYGILINPLNLDGSAATAANYVVNDSDNTINTMSGTMIFITNHNPVIPSSNGTETLQAVINFYDSLPVS
jgi:hypothetical protein